MFPSLALKGLHVSAPAWLPTSPPSTFHSAHSTSQLLDVLALPLGHHYAFARAISPSKTPLPGHPFLCISSWQSPTHLLRPRSNTTSSEKNFPAFSRLRCFRFSLCIMFSFLTGFCLISPISVLLPWIQFLSLQPLLPQSRQIFHWALYSSFVLEHGSLGIFFGSKL